MVSYCLKCRKNTKSKNPRVVRIINRRKIVYLIKLIYLIYLVSSLGISVLLLSDLPIINILF